MVDQTTSVEDTEVVATPVEVAQPTPQATPAAPTADVAVLDRDPLDTIQQSRQYQSTAERWGLTSLPSAPTLDESRRFKGIGSLDKFASGKDVQTLRQNQSDPYAIKAFDSVYGQGAALRYLSVPSQQDIQSLLAQRNDPEARKVFDQLYGDVSKPWIELMDPRSDAGTKKLAALFLSRIYTQGYDFETNLQYSGVGDVLQGMQQGAGKAVQELLQSARIINKDIVPQDTRAYDYPMTAGIAQGLTQFATGRVVIGTLLRPFTAGRDLSNMGKFIKELSLDAITSAFSFDPKDPLLGDAVKQLGWDKTTIPVLNEFNNFVANVDTIENFESEWSQRTARAVEQTGVSLVILGTLKLISYGYLAAKAKREGRIAEAEKFKQAMDDHAAAMQENFSEKAVQQELPLGNMNNADEAAQARMSRATGPQVRPGDDLTYITTARQGINEVSEPLLPMNLPEDIINMPKPRTPDAPYTPTDYLEREWGIMPQRELDLPNPNGPSVARSTSEFGQGNLFDTLPTQERAPPSANAKTITDKAKAEAEARVAAETKTGEQLTLDGLVDPNVRRVIDIAEGKKPVDPVNPADPLRALVNEIPDIAGRTLDEVQGKVSPFVNALADIAEKDLAKAVKVLSDSYSVQELKKLSALFNQTSKAMRDQIAILKAQVDDLIKKGEGAAADVLINEKIGPMTTLVDKIDKVNKPLGSIASDLLNLRRGKATALADEAIQRRVDELRQDGITYEQMQKVLDLESDGIKINTSQLRQAQANYEAAVLKGDEKAIKKALKEVKKAEDALQSQVAIAAKEKWDTLLEAVTSLSIRAKLYGFKTLAIVQPMGVAMNMSLRWAMENIGLALRGDFKGMARTNAAMAYAFKAENGNAVKTLLSFVKDSGKAAFRDEQLLTKFEATEAGQRTMKPLSSQTLGKLVPQGVRNALADTPFGRTVANAVDAADAVTGVPTKVMLFSDNLLGKAAAYIELGADSSAYFHTTVAERIAQVKGILKDKNLPADRRAALSKELTQLEQKPTIEVGGKVYTEEEFIKAKLESSFDANGKIIDPSLARRVDESLMKDKFQSGVGKFIEDTFGNNYSRLLLTPFVRQPLRGLQRGLELMPIVHWAQKQFRDDIRGLNGYRRQNIAMGKAVVGSAISIWIIDKVLSGETTGPGPSSYAERNEWMKTGTWKPNMMKIGGEWHDITNLDLLAPIVGIVHSIYSGYALSEIKRNPRHSEPEHMAATAGMIAGSIAMSILDKPGFQTVKDLAASFDELEKAGDFDPTVANKFERAAGRWSTGFIPNFLNHLNNTMDPTVVEPITYAQYWSKAMWNKDEVSTAFSYTGRPLEVLNTSGQWFGVFAGMDEKNMSKGEWVDNYLRNIGTLTGKKFAMEPTAPDPTLKGVDLRRGQSSVVRGTVWNHFMQEYGTVKGPNGKTLSDTYYDLLKGKETAQSVAAKLSIGSYQVDGDLPKLLTEIKDVYRKLAWSKVDARETAARNEWLLTQKAAGKQMRLNATDPAKDKTLPTILQNPLVKE